MRLKALLNILKLLKVDMSEITNYSNYSQCVSEAFALLNNTKLTLKNESRNYLGDRYEFKTNVGTSCIQVRRLNDVQIFMKDPENNSEKLKKSLLDLSKTLKWIAPFKVTNRYLDIGYVYLKCCTVTNSKVSLSLIKLALMKAKVEFEETSEYLRCERCAFMAYKNKADEINLIFNAAD